jgi:hypothetical protein
MLSSRRLRRQSALRGGGDREWRRPAAALTDCSCPDDANPCKHIARAAPGVAKDLAVHARLVDIDKRIVEAAEKHNAYLKELGLPPI